MAGTVAAGNSRGQLDPMWQVGAWASAQCSALLLMPSINPGFLVFTGFCEPLPSDQWNIAVLSNVSSVAKLQWIWTFYLPEELTAF